MPTFTANFTLNVIPVWERLFRRVKWQANAKLVAIEIGSHEGASALWFTANLLKSPHSVLYCIDPWEEDPQRFERFKQNIAESPDRGKVRPMRARSFDALSELIRQGVRANLIYVDGDHTARGALEDLVLAFRLLKPGGMMLCDDYQWVEPGRKARDLLARPKLAIDAFTTIYADRIRVILSVPIIQTAFVKLAD